jgi:glycerate dehydrogenase
MKIAVLDGYTLNPGDLDWSGLRALGDCEIHDRTPPDRVLERARGAGALLTNKVVLGRNHFEALPDLRYIGVLATGTNVVDLAAARERGIMVTNVPAYSTDSVAQLVFALLLHLTHRVGDHAASVRAGDWSRCRDFCYRLDPLAELSGWTMGLVGFGRIGRAVARIAQAFGMRVTVHTRRPPQDAAGCEFLPLDDLFRTADVVSLHCPLTPETERLVDRRRLDLMKPGAILLNTGRGPLLDEAAVAEALNSGRLGGAGLDVLSSEPPAEDNPLLTAPNCVITPHIGWGTLAARVRLLDIASGNLRAFLAGTPCHVVNS